MTIATPEKPAYPAVRQPMSYAAYLQQASETRIMEWVDGGGNQLCAAVTATPDAQPLFV